MIQINHLSFTYPGNLLPALQDINLNISDGTFCLLTGVSGCGKSTLLRALNGLVPHFSGGSISGSILVNGLSPLEHGPQLMSQMIGFVFQEPESQFIAERVEDEIAFSLENAAIPHTQMKQRVNEVLDLLGLAHLRRRLVTSLSGGECQRVAIAAALALRPSILALDEPTSQLDPVSAEEVLRALIRLNQSYGMTIVLAEHRLDRILPYVDQVVYLKRNIADIETGTPQEIVSRLPFAPPVVRLGEMLGISPLPLSPAEFHARQPENISCPFSAPGLDVSTNAEPALTTASLSYGYTQSSPAIHDISFSLHSGEIAVLMGANGSGKSTLLRCLVGLLRPQSGNIYLNHNDTRLMDVASICQKIAYLPQDPGAMLFANTVREELEITLRNHHLTVDPLQCDTILEQLGILHHHQDYPRDLSSGERQRVALGAVTITQPDIILLDEPTRGLDLLAKQSLSDLLHQWARLGKAILVVTHDVEFAASIADRVMLLDHGSLEFNGTPLDGFSQLGDFAPQMLQCLPGFGLLSLAQNSISGGKEKCNQEKSCGG